VEGRWLSNARYTGGHEVVVIRGRAGEEEAPPPSLQGGRPALSNYHLERELATPSRDPSCGRVQHVALAVLKAEAQAAALMRARSPSVRTAGDRGRASLDGEALARVSREMVLRPLELGVRLRVGG
jgi:hypothetical protein